jgi:hypothetical protein
MKSNWVVYALVLLLLTKTSGTAQTSSIPWSTVGHGGGVCLSSGSMMKSAIGQPLAGAVSGTNSRIDAGFFSDTLFRTTTSVTEGGSTPVEFFLDQNYPNPFNPSTTIAYGLPHASKVTIGIFNALGERVLQIVDGELQAGYHEVRFDASRLPSGVYFYRLQAGNFLQTRKLIVLR